MSSIDMMMQVGGNLYAMVTFAVAKVRVMYELAGSGGDVFVMFSGSKNADGIR